MRWLMLLMLFIFCGCGTVQKKCEGGMYGESYKAQCDMIELKF